MNTHTHTHTDAKISFPGQRLKKGERVLPCACLISSIYCKRACTPPLVICLHIWLNRRGILSLSLPTASCYSWPLMSATPFSFLALLNLADSFFSIPVIYSLRICLSPHFRVSCCLLGAIINIIHKDTNCSGLVIRRHETLSSGRLWAKCNVLWSRDCSGCVCVRVRMCVFQFAPLKLKFPLIAWAYWQICVRVRSVTKTQLFWLTIVEMRSVNLEQDRYVASKSNSCYSGLIVSVNNIIIKYMYLS